MYSQTRIFARSTYAISGRLICSLFLFLVFQPRIHSSSSQDAFVDEIFEDGSEFHTAEKRQIQDGLDTLYDTDNEKPTRGKDQPNTVAREAHLEPFRNAKTIATEASGSVGLAHTVKRGDDEYSQKRCLDLTVEQQQRLWLLQRQSDRIKLSPERKRASLRLVALKHPGDCALIPFVRFGDEAFLDC